MSYFYIFLTIFFTVYGQIVIKWQVSKVGALPEDTYQKILFLVDLLCNPWIVSALAMAFLASLTWMAAMTRLPLSYAYPFLSLSFVFVLILSGLLFNEVISPFKMAGVMLVMLGLWVGSRG